MSGRVLAISAAAIAMLCATAQAGSAIATTVVKHHRVPAICEQTFNPYMVAESVLRSCGDRIGGLQRVASLPGGGKAYSYGTLTQLVPPAHFNVLTASDKQLSEYGFPTRKELGSKWYKVMRHVRSFAAPTRYLVTDPNVSAPSANSDWANWSGYNVNSHNYTQVTATWEEPSFVTNGCNGDMFVQWVGIGGINSDYLGQDGTSFNVPGFAAHQGFIETIDGTGDPGSGMVVANITSAAGDSFYASTLWNAANSYFNYYMEDYTTGATYSAHSRTVSADQSTAEVISERPQVGGTITNPVYAQLSDFTIVYVTDATGYWGSSAEGFYQLSHNSDRMLGDGSEILATTDDSLSSNSNFQVYYAATQGDCA
jgi:hypothetical protein